MVHPTSCLVFVAVLFICNAETSNATGDIYDIGVGIADATGPAAEVELMGYAKLSQTAGGIHLRLFSRAFIFGDATAKRVVFVSVDAGMISQLVRMQVIKRLEELYGNLYTDENVCLSGTHTHSGPAGFFQYLLYDITSLGFIRQSMEALVDGIVLSIQRAHDSVQKGYIFSNHGTLLNANINRSPGSYLQNPPEERARYADDVDKEMYLLKLTDLQGNEIGMVNWFAVHAVSMNNTNKLISSDNKGYASLLFEQFIEPKSLPGKTKFVAAFAQSNEGDVSPNIFGPRCLDTGRPCDFDTSTCNGKNELCVASGPGKDMFESTSIIANRQFNKALELFNKASTPMTGPVKFIHQYVFMPNVTVQLNETTQAKTCKAALGYSFAAGTTDGPGDFDFTQHTKSGNENPFWLVVRDIVKAPSAETEECHLPKPIFLPTGEMKMPYLWTPEVINTQLLQIGSLVVVAVPGEFTTMSGRRTREAVQKALHLGGSPNMDVVIAGLSNIYTNYIATYEEYQFQRYEGASTLFGPHTLSAYIQQFSSLATHLAKNESISPGPDPPDLLSKQITLLPGVFMDTAPLGTSFGSVYKDAENSYNRSSIVEIGFICGNPRNNLQQEKTFLTVELYNGTSGEWTVVATDASWETKFLWSYSNRMLMQSKCQVLWEIPESAVPGKYIIRHTGYSKSFLSGIKPYEGSSSSFNVL
uniref:Neutral ceramidase n=1 Tax=Hemiscolopendra marginata TaxID=943146 RepID=A0A646QF66_9MYRI